MSGEGVAMMKRSSALGIITATALSVVQHHFRFIGRRLITPSLAVDTAEARFGHPLTPMSVAGINRRVNRRAYYGAAAAGAAGYGYYNYARRCAYWHAGACRRWY